MVTRFIKRIIRNIFGISPRMTPTFDRRHAWQAAKAEIAIGRNVLTQADRCDRIGAVLSTTVAATDGKMITQGQALMLLQWCISIQKPSKLSNKKEWWKSW